MEKIIARFTRGRYVVILVRVEGDGEPTTWSVRRSNADTGMYESRNGFDARAADRLFLSYRSSLES